MNSILQDLRFALRQLRKAPGFARLIALLAVAFGLLATVAAADPLTLTCAVALIALVALFAALIPATRAVSVNPAKALRPE